MIDFKSAIAVPINRRRDLPEVSGVYVVKDGDQVAYVGRAGNIRKRWKSHHVAKLISLESVIYCFLMPHSATKQVEKQWIDALQPPLNRQKPFRITLTPRSSATPRYASVTEALELNVPLLTELLNEGKRVLAARAAGQPDPRSARREQKLAAHRTKKTTSKEPDLDTAGPSGCQADHTHPKPDAASSGESAVK